MTSDTATEYDVFLSFRGPDTRCSIISFLYKALVDRKIRTFKDDKELEKGQSIPLELNRAIEDSKIVVVMVSATYAASGWCLDELVKIIDLQKEGKITVMPIFYGVEPIDVRRQINDVAKHFTKHEHRVDPGEVLLWRRAFTDLGNLSGECSSRWKGNKKLVHRIADEISKIITATKYDVFLSFRGIDTRPNLISFLYNALVDRKIRTFKDDEDLESGQRISSELICAIQDSKIAVVVVSVNYAASRWCLDELVTIMDLHEKKQITVIPIFYGVEPCDVRKQINGVAEHFKKHEDGVKDPERVSSWRRALTDLANLSGYCSSKWNNDAKLVNGIADKILKNPRIVTTSSNDSQPVENGRRMKEIKGLLYFNSNEDSRGVQMRAFGCFRIRY